MQSSFEAGGEILLEGPQFHYLKNVMRLGEGGTVRLFNGRDGEYLAQLANITKKSAALHVTQKIKDQPANEHEIHLLFAPLKKNRMDMVIEKATELGVTDFHPILTEHTDVRKLNTDRLHAQITEASEQCERLSLPRLHELRPLLVKLGGWPENVKIFWGRERGTDTNLAQTQAQKWAFLIGPVGGFSATEDSFLANHAVVQPISLGSRIYRAETASILCLAHAQLKLMAI